MKLASFASMVLISGLVLPNSVFAEDMDSKIQALQQEINELKASMNSSSSSSSPKKNGVSYKGVNLQLGGFLASETAFRSNNTESDIGTNYAKLPFAKDQGYGVSEFRGTERQSRFSLLASGDVSPTTHLAGYYELDFLGTGPTANANQSNSYTPRTRNIYATIDWDEMGLHLLAGQNWSLAVLNTKGITPRNEAVPLTIDAQYMVGFNWERQWQLRLVKDWEKTFWLALSLENAQTVNVGGQLAAGTGNTYQLPGVSLMPSTSNYSMNSYPDIILKFAWEADFGHFEVWNLLRNFQSRYGGTTAATQGNRQDTWADSVGLGFTVPVLWKQLDVTASGLYGSGAGRYGTTQLADATYAADGSLNPLVGTQYLVQLVYHTTNRLDIYGGFGQEMVASSVGGGGAFGFGDNVTGTNNAGCSNVGGTCTPFIKQSTQANIGAWWAFYKGDYGVMKLGAQYSHTTLDTFADASNFAPSTNQDMFFTSLRYYPF